MTGIRDLSELLKSLSPAARPDEYVFVVADEARVGELPFAALIREDEGTTLVMLRRDADAAGLPYEFVAAWITLTVHSALEAVGLTGAFARALADAGISCNVLAGVHHDHILVPADRREDALAALRALAEG